MIRLRKSWPLLAFYCLLLAGEALPVAARDDFVVILDQSGSMREKVPGNPKALYENDPRKAQKSYGAIQALNEVVSHLLKDGDYFALITIGDRAEVVISQLINYPHERKIIQKQLSEDLPFKDDNTDITAGVDAAKDLLKNLREPYRKILVLITDGNNEPPKNSPFQTVDQQNGAYSAFREAIRAEGWNVNLVGLGPSTDIGKVADNIGLPQDRVAIMREFKSGEIEKKLGELFDREYRSLVTMRVEPVGLKPETITLKLKPKIWGGYDGSTVTLVLKSSFEKSVKVRVSLAQTPMELSGAPGVRASLPSTAVDLQPDQEQRLRLNVTFGGQRPPDGLIRGTYTFKFAPGSTPFYPQQGPLEIYVPSWWEAYGVWAITAAIGVLLALGVLAWLIRRAQVPEVRVVVSAYPNRTLGETITLRKRETLTIANGQLVGRVVSAPGLSCNTAATVRYLGRRKFAVVAEEASIVQADGPTASLTVGLDEPFDLKDSTGKVLRDVMLSTPGRAGGGAFAGQHDSDTL